MSNKLLKREKRMCDSISLKVQPGMRTFLENMAKERQIGLCEAARISIQYAIDRTATGEVI